jgi:ATP phosphoribosyltransferase regulatory subunit HisZ
MSSERIKELEKQIAELNSRWPAHSVTPAMLQQMDELEAELAEEIKRLTDQQEKASVADDDQT